MSPRTATTVVFFATGGIFAAWGARTPAVQEELSLSAGELRWRSPRPRSASTTLP